MISDAFWIGAIERAIVANGLIWLELMGIYLAFPRVRSYPNGHTAMNLLTENVEGKIKSLIR